MFTKTEKLGNPFICHVNILYEEKGELSSFNPSKCAGELEGDYLKTPKEPKTKPP